MLLEVLPLTITKISSRIIIAVSILCAATAAFAHPPRAVNLTWNRNGTLAVSVEHPVNDPEKHFINKIVVYVDDGIAAQKEYQTQGNAQALADSFQLGALPPGTTVKVEAFCIIMGSLTNSLTIP